MSEEKKYEDVGAIWEMRSGGGKKYLSISITINGEKMSFVAFKNRKAKDTHPDYRVFPPKPREKKQDDIF